MANNSVVPFSGTKKQEEELKEALQALKGTKGALMPALQKAQEIYGYLPIEVQTMVAEGLDVSLSEVYGVSTFYSQFTLTPKGKYKIGICLGTACYVKGSGAVYEKLQQLLGISSGEITKDGLFSLDATRCVGCCGLAPVMTVNGEVYGKVTVDNVESILDMYKE